TFRVGALFPFIPSSRRPTIVFQAQSNDLWKQMMFMSTPDTRFAARHTRQAGSYGGSKCSTIVFIITRAVTAAVGKYGEGTFRLAWIKNLKTCAPQCVSM